MFLLNFLNRNNTDAYYPLFECIYSVEIMLILFQIVVSILVIKAVWRSQLHMNLRLRLNLCIFHAALCNIVRVCIIYYQLYGPINPDELDAPVLLIVCSVIKEAFITYMCTLIVVITIDRYYASKHWFWYEKGGYQTNVFFVAMESVHLLSASIASVLLTYEYRSDLTNLIENALFMIIGVVLYRLLYRSDCREMDNLKKGANVNSYSISRSYQLRESIYLMKMFGRISVPFGVSVLPVFVFYLTYSTIPPGIGYDFLRYVSIALYDAWMPLMAIIVITSIPLCQPQIAKHMPPRLRFSLYSENAVIVQRTVSDETNAYFNQLSHSWS